MPGISSFQQLRQQRHAQWLEDLKQRVNALLEAERWAARLLDQGVALDAIGLDRKSWRQLPEHHSVIWQHVARDAQPLLKMQP